MQDKKTNIDRQKQNRKVSAFEKQSLLRSYRSEAKESASRSASRLCILLAFGALALLILYIVLFTVRTTDNRFLLPSEFPYVVAAIVLSYSALCILILALSGRSDLSRFAKRKDRDATDASAIRLFKDQIDLPYVVTDADGKIIVANRAFEDAARGKHTAVGEDIRAICTKALDEIIRTTAAESNIDKRIADIHSSAVRAYPTALQFSTTADACLSLLRDIDRITEQSGLPKERDSDSPLLRVHEIASAAFREAEKRSALWTLCLGTLENILNLRASDGNAREKRSYIYELARDAYRRAIEKETETRRENTLRAFSASLRKIISIAENDPTARQFVSAVTLRLDMFEQRNLLPHTRTLLLNIRSQLASALPDPTVVTDDKDTVTLQTVLRLTDEALQSILTTREDDVSEAEFSRKTLSAILNAARSAGEDSVSHSIRNIRDIAETALDALTPDRAPEYVAAVTDEIISATDEKKETSPAEDEVRKIAQEIRTSARSGSQTDEERFIASFRDALRRIAEESRLALTREGSEAERIKSVIEKEVSGTLAYFEIRTEAVSVLSGLIKYAEETQTFRDLDKNDKRLLGSAVTQLRELLSLLRASTSASPTETYAMSRKISDTLSRLLSEFDKNGDYTHRSSVSEDEHSARARVKGFYARLESAAARAFPQTSKGIRDAFFTEIAPTLRGSRLYHALIPKAERLLEQDAPTPASVRNDFLPEVADRAYADHFWNESFSLLLLHIGTLKVSTARHPLASLSDSEHFADITFEKLFARRLLSEVLAFHPITPVLAADREGASADALYKIAFKHFSEASTHRSRVLLTACRSIITRAFALLDSAPRLFDCAVPEEEEACARLKAESAHAYTLLMAEAGSSAREDFAELSVEILRGCAKSIEASEKQESTAGVLHAALTYLADFLEDFNNRLLRREFFRTYRDASSAIVSLLYRAEYTNTALSEVRKISESVLKSGGERAVTFSGLSIEDCCSESLRKIAGLAGTDVLQELTEASDDYAVEALAAKSVWELRERALFEIEKRLSYALACHAFRESLSAASRTAITRLTKVAREVIPKLCPAPDKHSRKAATVIPPQKEQKTLIAELLPLFEVLEQLENATEQNPKDTPSHRIAASARRAKAASGEDFAVFLKAFRELSALISEILADANSCKQRKKLIRQISQMLKEERSATVIPDTGTPISRAGIAELFSEYLNATRRLIRPLIDSDPLFGDISRIISATREQMEDDSSPYFRLYAASSLAQIAKRIQTSYASEQYKPLLAPLAKFLTESAETVGKISQCPTKESIMVLSLGAFRDADSLFRLGEIAADADKILTAFSADALPSAGDCNRIYNTLSEICQKIDACLQGVLRGGTAVIPLKRLSKSAKVLYKNAPELDKDHYSAKAYAAMYTFFGEVAEIASPYRLLIEQKEPAVLRAEVSRVRRNVSEISDATATGGNRAIASSALSAIGQYAESFRKEERITEIATAAIAELSAIPDAARAPERIYGIATEALSEIIAKTSKKQIRDHALLAHVELSERRILYRLLMSDPIEALSSEFRDPTDEKIYPKAEALYAHLSHVGTRFGAELIFSLLRDTLESIRTLTAPGAFSRIRAISAVLQKSVDEFEADIRALPLGTEESFVPPTIRAKQKQIRAWLERLYDFSNRAVTESKEDAGKQAIADQITLIVYKGISTFDEIAAGNEEGAINRLPDTCRKILSETLAVLRETELSARYLADIRKSADLILGSMSLPSPLDTSVSEEAYAAQFKKQLQKIRKALSTIPDAVARFRKETEELPQRKAVGSFATERCETLISAFLTALEGLETHPEMHPTVKLLEAVGESIERRIRLRGEKDLGSMIAVYDKKGRPSGRNNAESRAKSHKRDAFIPIRRNDEATYLEHGLSIAKSTVTAGESVTLGGKRYIARSYEHESGARTYYLVTFTEIEDTLSLKQSCEDENTVVAFITLDNLEELAQYVRIDHRQAEKEVEKLLRSWAGQIHGIFHEYERDKYILFFSQKEMISLVNSKFSDLLSRLEGIKLGDSSVSVTISMGISALGSTLTTKEQNANAALDMALKRGGAQIVIYRDAENQEDRYEFFSSNRVKGLQKENRVGPRVVANYLCELIEKAGDVLIMGHSYPDFDSIGSCVGIAALARHYKKDVHIVVNRRSQNFIDCTPDLLTLPEYQNIFVDGTTGMELKGTDTLLVLCDVSNTNIMEYVDIARSSFNTVIIDHHFKTTDSDDLRTLLTYIDPSASSASELVAEILSEVLPKDELKKEEANVLLSGIMVDTKNFTRSVGARTFAAALYLRQMGANAEISSTYFYEQSGDYKAEVVFRKNLSFHPKHKEIAITFCSLDDIRDNPEVASCDLRVAASKAADKLLTVRGIRASFALYAYSGGGREGVAISGRSDGSVNVQQILEVFHGGGHFDSAGANLPGKSVSSVVKALTDVVTDYFSESEEEDDGEEEV